MNPVIAVMHRKSKHVVRHCFQFFTLLVCLFSLVETSQADIGSAKSIPLPPIRDWDVTLADLVEAEKSDELVVPLNYKIGRVVSPATSANAGELFTLSVNAKTWFAAQATQELYCFWIEIECLKGDKVIETTRSPELLGTYETDQLLAVTTMAPKGTSSVRAVLCAQNKQWSIVKNKATIRQLNLLRLSGAPGTNLEIEPVNELGKKAGARDTSLAVKSDWPDGTAITLTTTRGSIPKSALLVKGRAEVEMNYTSIEVGQAKIIARIGESETTLTVEDPLAARLKIDGVLAVGLKTSAVIQLVQDGKMLPGRYQMSVPGIFITPPWSVDLAPGTWTVRVCRGPQFQAMEKTIEAQSGKTIDLGELELSRLVDLPGLGWYGGDADGDVYHGERVYTDVNAASAMQHGQAMGLDWLGVGSWSSGEFGGPRPKTWGEVKVVMKELSRPNFLFNWTDEKPKSREGHACFIGLSRPEKEAFGWGWTGAKRPLRNFELLHAIRASGGATFANHPLRWWVNGAKFNTNMYASLPFDLCAAGLLDGVNINDKPAGILLWSMLLDHGYRVAATAGADFCLDRPGGPVPGLHRMYCYCPDGVSLAALAEAVRQERTIVSTGPVLLASLNGQPPGSTFSTEKTYQIPVKAWARGDQDDPLKRLELWSHGKAVATKSFSGKANAETVFDWQPKGEWDWVAVCAVSHRGWAMTSAFYAVGKNHRPPEPIKCRVTLEVKGLTQDELSQAAIEVWDNVSALVTSKKLTVMPLKGNESLEVPISASIVIRLPEGRMQEASLYDVIGMPEAIEKIASGIEREEPLLRWSTYDALLKKSRQATVRVNFNTETSP